MRVMMASAVQAVAFMHEAVSSSLSAHVVRPMLAADQSTSEVHVSAL